MTQADSKAPTEHTYHISTMVNRLDELRKLFADQRTNIVWEQDGKLTPEQKEIVAGHLGNALLQL